MRCALPRAAPLVCLALLSACAGAGVRLQEAVGPRITQVAVAGNRAVPARRILAKIVTSTREGPEGHLDRGVLSEDVRRVRDIYEEAGYYGARVVAQVVPDDARAREVEVTFRVEEGSPTRVRSLLVSGLEGLPAPLRGDVLADLPLHEGELLVEERYESLKRQLEGRLRSAGYAAAKVDAKVAVSPTAGDAEVAVRVSPGDEYRFGEIEVRGNLLVPAGRIRQAAGVVLRTGQRFSPEALQEAGQEVFALGTFNIVTANAGEPDPARRLVPVTLAVEEADFLRFRFGSGLGADQNRQQVRAIADFTHLNLLGLQTRLDFDNELAYRFLPGLLQPARSGIAGSSALELTRQDLIGPRLDLAVRLRYERELAEAFTAQSVSGRIGTPLRLRRWLTFVPSYNITRYFDVEGVPELRRGQRAPLLLDCPEPCLLSYVEQRLIADRRDDPIEPRAGWYAAVGVQEGGGILRGSFDWVRLVPDLRGYVRLTERVSLAARLELGWLLPLDERGSPIVARFFGGGASGFRGVGAGRLSPLIVTRDGDIVPIGGNSSVLASGEVRWTLSQSWSVAAFTDAADVELAPADAFDDLRLQLAVGAGVRYRTPVGPARLDVAYRPLRRPSYPVNAPASPVETGFLDYAAFFLSIGEAF